MSFTHSIARRFTLALAFGALALAFGMPAHAADAPAGKVNINTANVEQLSQLPRVGPKVAQRIVEFRKENGPFKKAEELMGVKGIGEKTFEGLRPFLSLDGDTTLTGKVPSPRKKAPKKEA